MSASETVKVPAWTVKLLPILGGLGLGYATWTTNGWMDEVQAQLARDSRQIRSEMKSVANTVDGIEKEMAKINLTFSGQLSSLDMRAQSGRADLNARLVKTESELDAIKEEMKGLRRRRPRNTHSD